LALNHLNRVGQSRFALGGNGLTGECDDGGVGVVAAVVVGIAVLVGLAIVLGLVDSPMSTEPSDRLDAGIPADRHLTSHDIGELRFRVGLRGYRMDDVDQALDRLRDSLRELEQPGGESPSAAEPRDETDIAESAGELDGA
jgi:DivIVA domain-containing protein